jgi:hypothetical protein
MKTFSRLLAILMVCHVSIVSAQGDASLATYYQTSEVQPLMVQYDADKGSLSRFYTIVSSPERRERFKTFNRDYLARLEQLKFEKMPVSSQVDFLLFKRQLNNELRLLDKEEKEYNSIHPYLSFADSIYRWEQLRRRGAHLQSESVAVQMKQMLQQSEQQLSILKSQGTMNMSLALRAEATARGLQAALKSVYIFYAGYDPDFTRWVPRYYQALDSALSVYADLLKSKGSKEGLQKPDNSGITGTPIGREELVRQLQYEMIPYSPDELVAIANREFAWCDAEMLKASAEMGFGNNWKAALEKVKNTYVPEGKQPEMIMDLYHQSINFVRQHDMVTIPPLAEETWRMIMMSPAQQLVSPFFLGGEVLQIAYPTNTMDSASRMMSMRGNNPHFSRATVHHELIAGHHLQGFMNNRYKPYRDFHTPFWTEGWALYWEFLLWDAKFPRSPEDKIGMLFWRMHRCARIIFSLNYHLGNWTPQQCIDFLVERVGHERANAEGEVRRSFTGGYGPLYQLAYMTGAFQFYALKKELVDSGRMSLKQFNDAVLRENNIPVEMVRAILTNQPLKRDFTSSWRFYKDK